MKNKSQHHKETNTFRFKGFQERIKNVKVSCRKYVLYSGTENDNDSELYTTLNKFGELNLSDKFKNFHRGFSFELKTLAQVLYFENKIAEVIEEHINVANEFSLPAILGCLCAFAIDLAELFYEKYFEKFVAIIHEKLDIHCNENVENIFVCYASLFTSLAKYLKKDICELLFKENTFFFKYFIGHPWYISELAAKCLSHIVRQLPKKEHFFKILFKYLEENDDAEKGVGSLICSSLQLDIPNRLHSTTNYTLNVLFNVLKDPDTPKEAGRRALVATFKSLTFFVSKEYNNSMGKWYDTWKEDSKYVWPVLLKHFQSAAQNELTVDTDFVLTILSVASVILECKNGQLLTEPEILIDATIEILNYKNINDIGSDVLLIFKTIVTSAHYRIGEDSTRKIFSAIFNSTICTETVLSLIEGIFTAFQFDSIICPMFLNYCSSVLSSPSDKEKCILEVLANIGIYKSSAVRCAAELDSCIPFELDFSSYEENLMQDILQKRMIKLNTDLSNIEDIIMSIVLLRHVVPLKKNKFVAYMKKMHSLCTCLISGSQNNTSSKKLKTEFSEETINEEGNVEKLIFLMSVLTETLHKLLSEEEFIKHFALKSHVLVIKQNSFLKDNHNYLRILEIICCTVIKKNDSLLPDEVCEELYSYLHSSLSSTKSLVRMLTASIFSSFPCVRRSDDTMDDDETVSFDNMFTIMVRVESIQPHPSFFKERLRLMRLLEFDQVSAVKPTKDTFDLAPLHFMIGQLTVNYSDLWTPVMEGITAYAKNLSVKKFWLVWHGELKTAAKLAFKQLNYKRLSYNSWKPDVPALQNLLDVQSTHDSAKHLTSRVSAVDFRERLWKGMVKFPEVVNKRGEDIVNLFLTFIEEEVTSRKESVNSHHQNVSKRDIDKEDVQQEEGEDVQQEEGEDVQEEDEVQHEEEEEESDQDDDDGGEVEEEKSKKRSFRKAPLSTLIIHMSLFGKLSKLKKIYKARELEQVFERFLFHPIVDVQKKAMYALYSFEHDYLVTYKDFLNSVLDEKSLRKEMTLFSAEDEGPDEGHSLKAAHKKGFMRILLRILYGKMNSRSTQGRKSKHSDKQTVVVRFLATLKEEHIKAFIALLFEGIYKDFQGDSLEDILTASDKFNPKRTVPLKRLKGFLKTVNLVIDKMGNLLVESCTEVFKVILFVISTSSAGIDNEQQIAIHYVQKYKQIRQLATRRLISFFTMFDGYQLSNLETEALLVSINQQTLALTKDGLWTTNIVMKLFMCWSGNSAFHALLAVSDKQGYPSFKYIVDVLQHPRCTSEVITDILSIVSNLLFEATKTDSLPTWTEVLPILNEAKENGFPNLTIGEGLVYKYSQLILEAIHKRLVDNNFSTKELSILLKICDWVAHRESAGELMKVIIPILESKALCEEKSIYLLNVCDKLIGMIDKPDKHLKNFLELLSCLKERHVRAGLCTVIKTMMDRYEDNRFISSWCVDLNSYDPSKIEDEDLGRRHSCYKEINKFLENSHTIDRDSVLCVICNCFFVVENVAVSSLVELSALSIQNVFQLVNRLHETDKPAGMSMLNNALKKLRPLLKSEDEKVQTTAWRLLESAVKHCHSYHAQLLELYRLQNGKDAGCDFFSNVVHLQLHKRTRVLSKLAEKILAGDLKFGSDTIVGYLMPSVTTYLFNDLYSKEDTLVTAAITCLGAFAGCLPWPNYQNLLKSYLKVMDRDLKYLRQGVRSLEVIIDAFHETFEDHNSPTYCCLVNDLIPKIEKVFSARVSSESMHKLTKKAYPEDTDVKKISLGLALVKLLNKLPKHILMKHARNVLLRLIQFLRSKAETIRKQAREMLVKVIKEIGPSFVSVCIKDMTSLLERGYQRHVCVFTIYALLRELEDDIKPNDIDMCVEDVVGICMDDMFGGQAEEKDVAKIVIKCPEARADRGDSMLGVISKFIGKKHLQLLMNPLYQMAQTSNKTIVNKVDKCLLKISAGLSQNSFIDIETKSIFIYSMYDEKMEEIFAANRRINKNPKKEVIQDCFLLDPEPKVVKQRAKVNIKATAHVFVEFALGFLHNLVRHNKYVKSEKTHLQLLDSFISKLGSSLVSEYPGISINALRVIDQLMLFPLPSLKEHLPQICKQMFVILDQFSTYNLPKGKNYNMMQRIFSTLARAMKNVTDLQLETDHLKVLIYYARDNIPKSGETHSIFLLLKSMLFRKINIPEFHELMKTIQKQSIEAENVTMLDQSRSAYFYYMMNYPKFSKQHLSALQFYTGNLTYKGPLGRMSAVLMIQEILTKYPRTLFTKELDEGLWLILSQEHYKESSTELKLLLAKCISLLFGSCLRKEALINLSLKLMKDDENKSACQNAVRSSMVVQSLYHMLDAPAAELPKKVFTKILPRVVILLDQDRYMAPAIEESDLHLIDLYMHSLLELLRILCAKYFSKNSISKWTKVVDGQVWTLVLQHLSYPLLESKLSASIILDHLFSAYPISNKVVPPLLTDTFTRKKVVFDLCKLFDTVAPSHEQIFQKLCHEAVRNLLYVIRMSDTAPLNIFANESVYIEKKDKKFKGSPMEQSTYWLLLHLSKQIDRSQSRTEFLAVCKEALLNFIAGVIVVFPDGVKTCSPIAKLMVTNLENQIKEEDASKILLDKANDVIALLKEQIGVMQYNDYSIDVK